MLVKSKSFWLLTALFILISLAVIWLVFPPIFSQYRQLREEISNIENTIANQEKFIANIKSLTARQDQLEESYQFFARALPTDTNAEMLLLELDGLLENLNISADLTVPFETPSTTSSGNLASSSGSENESDEVKPGSQGANQPTVVSDTAKSTPTAITIAGEFGFQKAKELLVALRSFIRLNKVSSLTITSSGQSIKTTINCQVFSVPAQNLNYSGSQEILEKADGLISQLKSYTTTPDITKEGRYGKSDPFN